MSDWWFESSHWKFSTRSDNKTDRMLEAGQSGYGPAEGREEV